MDVLVHTMKDGFKLCIFLTIACVVVRLETIADQTFTVVAAGSVSTDLTTA